ncbi:MAG: hypothetical protein GY796_31150 [Chloroflexi bacterium]|nr:hypothetical protein [Chloroflexota bacterium]
MVVVQVAVGQLARLWSDRLGNASVSRTVERFMAAKPIAAEFLQMLRKRLAVC